MSHTPTGQAQMRRTMDDAKHHYLLETILASIRLRTMDAFLPVALANIVNICGAERGILLFPGGHAHHFTIRCVHDARTDAPLRKKTDFSHSIPREVFATGQPVLVRSVQDENSVSESVIKYKLISIMCVPLKIGKRILGALYVDSRTEIKDFCDQDHDILLAIANHVALAVENVRLFEEEKARQQSLELENETLRQRLNAHSQIIGTSASMQKVYDMVRKVSPSEAAILLLGENGTGKEAMAHLIHELSPRSEKPFLVVDCASIPATLMESELFGYEQGAFTGAAAQKIGKFESARNGTVFLDELAELPIDMQAKLLRVLQEKEITRVGGVAPVMLDFRVIAATNRNLEAMVRQGQFRADLYYRLKVIKIEIPPLRDRADDIPLLANFFLQQSNKTYGKNIRRFHERAIRAMLRHTWPGNVRELKHCVERAVIVSEEDEITASVLNLEHAPKPRTLDASRRQWEKEFIYQILLANQFSMNKTAAELDISRQHLFNLIKKYNLQKDASGGGTGPRRNATGAEQS